MQNSEDAPANNRYSQEAGIKPLDSGIAAGDVEKRSYLSYVEECADLLMEYGTDRYGEKHSPLLVTILDVRTRTCPELPPKSAARVVPKNSRMPIREMEEYEIWPMM